MASVVNIAINSEPDGIAVKQIVSNIVQSFLDAKHALDHLVALRDSGAGSNWAAVAAALGAANAADGQAAFNTVNTINAYMLNAHDAAAPLDALRPV